MNEAKSKAVREALARVTKQYGNDSAMLLGDGSSMAVEKFPSGSLSLDYALGGGIPVGRIVEVYGPESGGKTTLALHMIKEVQERGGACAFIDAENALDPEYASNIGVNLEDLTVSQPECGETALSITEGLVNSGAFDLIVIDSVAALVPKRELDGEMGDAMVGLHARMMSQAMRKLAGPANKFGCTLVFINQIREKVGVMYGNPETTTGGRALKFYASVRLEVRKTETLKDANEATANHVKVKVVKNKVAPPYRVAEFDINFGTGIDTTTEVVDLAVKMGIIARSGSYYTYEDLKTQGLEKMKKALESSEEDMNDIRNKILEALKGGAFEKEEEKGPFDDLDLPEAIE